MNDKILNDKSTWDWQTPEKQILVKEWEEEFNWVQEPCVSPDGESIAAIVNVDEAAFSVCNNGETWEETFEKAWSLKFGPDGRLAALTANDEEWTVCVDGECWEGRFDYAWDLKFSPDGSFISAAIQQDSEYGMSVNDTIWETLYKNISGTLLGPLGNSAAVVQVDHMDQADIEAFAAGLFCVAVNGELQSERYVNIESICFDSTEEKTAFSIRKNRLEYSIASNSGPWKSNFQFAWEPRFINHGASVIAPVRQNGKWHLFKDDSDFWNRPFEQLWKPTVHDITGKIAAVVSETFGKWGICENNTLLNFQCNTMISELFYSGNGEVLVALFKDNDAWDIAVIRNAKVTPWGLKADKLWAPVISADTKIAATRMEKNNRYYLVVNGKVYQNDFDMMFEPAISPNSDKILLKAIKNGIYYRQTLSLDKVL